ncbi:hypothetical protein RPPS3_25490 [Rhodopseudomonas palustris]|uniref:MT-A70 family methyltransferase n=1 Tax=Rhodopseudomonas palustris TaxID=1076 RepID=UPI000D1AF71F|nr:MT-A70 family methyltransferase [Rhodopseudomonas palustris]AVT76612.1 hypothetical protein RPPS3_25490 [Rhodopseudomonas palustris]
MNVLAQYAEAREVLAKLAAGLSRAESFDEWSAMRLDLEHVKLQAKLIKDRALLIEAQVTQVRAERRLGAMLAEAREAGTLAVQSQGRRPAADVAAEESEEAPPPATLKEIGIDKKLAARAAAAAQLADDAFEELLQATREKFASGKAIIVDPIKSAEKTADIQRRRDNHAARTVSGGRVEDLHQLVREGRKFGFIGMDPQWQYATWSDAGAGRSAGMHYKTEDLDAIAQMPVGELLADGGALGMWVVDWALDQAAELIRRFGLTYITVLFTWVKTTARANEIIAKLLADGVSIDIADNRLWHFGQGHWSRANPEMCWLATKGKPKRLHADVRQLIVAPIMEHSRKPDEWLARAERLFEGPYLELNARRLRPGWVSWGDELEFTGVATAIDAGVATRGTPTRLRDASPRQAPDPSPQGGGETDAEPLDLPAFLPLNKESNHDDAQP